MSVERPLTYKASVSGISGTIKAILSLQEAVQKMASSEISVRVNAEKVVTETAQKSSGQRRKTVDEESKHNENVKKSQLALEKKLARESVQNAERAEKDKLRALSEAEREKTKIREAESRKRFAAEKREAAEMYSFQKKQAREYERAAKQAQRDAMFDAKRLYRSIGTGFVEGGRGAIGLVGNTITRGVQGISQGLGLNDAWNVGSIVGEYMGAQKSLTSVAIEARGAGQAFDFDKRGAYSKIASVATKTGLGQKDLLHAIDVYSEKGSGATAIRDLEKIAEQALAMDTDTGTVAKLRSQLEQQADVAGYKLTSEQLDKWMANLHFGGKTGVFRGSDIAKESEALLSAASTAGLRFDNNKDMIDFQQFIQFARTGKGSAAETRTSVVAAWNQVAKKRDKLHAMGIKTDNADGTKRSAIDVIMDTIEATRGDESKMTKLFDPSRSGAAINPHRLAFRNKYLDLKKSGMSDAKAAALAKEFTSNRLKMGLDGKGLNVDGEFLKTEMQKDVDARLNDPGQKIKQNIERVRQSFLTVLLPVLEKFSEKLPAIVANIQKAMKFVTENPALTAMALGTTLAGAGMIKGAASHVLGGAARWVGDRLAQSHVGGRMGVLSKGAAALFGSISQAGATPVYITGAAPGVMGGGGIVDALGGGAMPSASAVGSVLQYAAPAIAALALGILGAHVMAKVAPDVDKKLNNRSPNRTATKEEMAWVKDLKKVEAEKREGMIATISENDDFKYAGLESPYGRSMMGATRALVRNAQRLLKLRKTRAGTDKKFVDGAYDTAANEWDGIRTSIVDRLGFQRGGSMLKPINNQVAGFDLSEWNKISGIKEKNPYRMFQEETAKRNSQLDAAETSKLEASKAAAKAAEDLQKASEKAAKALDQVGASAFKFDLNTSQLKTPG